jgi:hypothetical protein
MQKILHFLSYHNAIPIALGILFLGSASAFAATNPEIILKKEQSVVSIDNTYIANANLDAFTPSVQVTGVTEDSEYYYVTYQFSTIALEDYVWQDVTKQREMTVAKEFLGNNKDLGLYVTKQLGEVIDSEIIRLKETQEFERRNITNKMVATAYSGLVGAFLDERTETLPGYRPVVREGNSENETDPVAVAKSKQEEARRANAVTRPTANSTGKPTQTASQSPVVIQLLGNNPARVPLNAQYSDLGAVVTVNGRIVDYSIETFLDGVKVTSIQIDTSTSTRYVIGYRAKDGNGNVGEAERIILVGNADPLPGDQSDTGNSQPPLNEPPANEPPISEPVPEPAATSTATSTDTDIGTTTPEVTPPADIIAPGIILIGNVAVAITEGETYTDAGATASDPSTGSGQVTDLTSEIVVGGSVDTNTAGEYTLTYDVTDAAGNVAQQVTRTVVVEPAPEPQEEAEPTSEPEPEPVATSTATTTTSGS